MPITFPLTGSHWPTSQAVRRELAEREQKIILSFSRGKDSLALWLALLDDGVKPENIYPLYYYDVLDLSFQEPYIKYIEEVFETHIHQIVHPATWRMFWNGTYQPVTHTGVMIATDPGYRVKFYDIEEEFRRQQGLDMGELSPVVTGVRAADSIARRTMIMRSGPYQPKVKRLAATWDWRRPEVLERIERAGIRLADDYQLFLIRDPKTGKYRKNSGRSFDGVARQFLEPLREQRPDDLAKILDMFPMAEFDLFRHDLK